MLAYFTRAYNDNVIPEWTPFIYQIGNHFKIGLVYCLHMYTFIQFNIIFPRIRCLFVFPFFSTVFNILIQVQNNSDARGHMQ